MAKKPELNMFKSTEGKPPEQPTERQAEPEPQAESHPDRTVSVGVGLKQSQLDELDSIAAGLGIARNNLIRWAVAYLLANADGLDLAAYIESGKGRVKLRMP